jgi:hypothetical protein
MRRSFLNTLRLTTEEFTLLGQGHYKLTHSPSEEVEEFASELAKYQARQAATAMRLSVYLAFALGLICRMLSRVSGLARSSIRR